MLQPASLAFSRLIERIYDCAIDAALWPATIAEIGDELGFAAGALLVVDLTTGDQFHLAEWNCVEKYQRLFRERFAADGAAMFERALAASGSVDEPLTLSRGPFDMDAFRRSPMYLEWARPQGFGDTTNVVVLRERDRLASLTFSQRAADGRIADKQIAALRFLAPHLRRTVAIGELLNRTLLRARDLSETLDRLTAGAVLTDAHCRVLFANASAQAMLARGRPIALRRDRLSATNPTAEAELRGAIAASATSKDGLGAAGIGTVLNRPNEPAATALVLPLSGGTVRPGVKPGAAAAVFVAAAAGPSSAQVAAVARSFGLTRAEAKLLDRLVFGRPAAAVARELGISPTTVKTHLAHIFGKTGVTRQSDLIRLVLTMAPPIAVCGKPD